MGKRRASLLLGITLLALGLGLLVLALGGCAPRRPELLESHWGRTPAYLLRPAPPARNETGRCAEGWPAELAPGVRCTPVPPDPPGTPVEVDWERTGRAYRF